MKLNLSLFSIVAMSTYSSSLFFIRIWHCKQVECSSFWFNAPCLILHIITPPVPWPNLVARGLRRYIASIYNAEVLVYKVYRVIHIISLKVGLLCQWLWLEFIRHFLLGHFFDMSNDWSFRGFLHLTIYNICVIVSKWKINGITRRRSESYQEWVRQASWKPAEIQTRDPVRTRYQSSRLVFVRSGEWLLVWLTVGSTWVI